jgi:hypothetical protein
MDIIARRSVARRIAALRNDIAACSTGLPTVQVWLDRVACVGHPAISAAVEGIWCGRDGREVLDVEGLDLKLVVGWHNGKVEFSYLS